MLEEILQRLYARRRFGMRPGLERMEALLARLDHPERSLVALHIAGTNGKGSVAAFCDSVLRTAGLAVGRFTSPHLLRFNERICINGEPVSDSALLEALRAVEAAASGSGEAAEATFFECATAAALLLFRQHGLQLAVVEVGLGGRLDATNVLTPLLSVITRIGLEHCEYLGDTLEKIAAEKGGIIKAGRPVVIGAMPDEARDTLVALAKRQGAALRDATQMVSVTAGNIDLAAIEAHISSTERDLGKVRLGVNGLYQLENVATAVAALEVCTEAIGIELSDKAFKTGLEQTRWPGRFQLVRRDPPVVVDGAHNPDAAAALALALRRSRFKGPFGMVAGFCDDKDVAAILRSLVPRIRRAWAVETPSARTLPAAETLARMRAAGIADATAANSFAEAVAEAERWAREQGGALVICGSLFLAGAALRHYEALPWSIDSDGRVDSNEQLRATPRK